MRNPQRAGKPFNPFRLWGFSIVVGVVAGLGAAVFRGLIGLFHNVLFLGEFSFHYNANVHTPSSPWGPFVILVPVVGAAGVAFLVKNYAIEAKGHGVPEVMDAIYYNKGVIRPVVAVVKSLASALSIGSGGSVGREGPIVQIGSSFGSTFGQLLHLPTWQRITLIAAGAGAGIAATFNTPIGGVLFAAELMLHEVSVWTLVPVVIATAIATYIGQLLLGASPSFIIPAFEIPYFHLTSPWALVAYVGLGGITGVVSVLFIKSVYGFEDFFDEKIPGNYYTRHLLGMLIVGLLIYGMKLGWGHYYIEGVGYATVQDIFDGTLSSFFLLLLLFALKLIATSLTLGSGGSGGIFSPSLFLGATLGGAYGVLLKTSFPALAISAPAMAVVGMAGVVAGATGAAITSIVMIFEMTVDYHVILPMTITVAISYGIRKVLCTDSIYTLKLTRRGHLLPEALQANFHLVRPARDLMEGGLARVPAATPLNEIRRLLSVRTDIRHVLVEKDGSLIGILDTTAVQVAGTECQENSPVGSLANNHYLFVTETTRVFELLSKMRSVNADYLLVVPDAEPLDDSQVKGIISRQHIAECVIQATELFAE